jgi:hypothetical protein
VFAHRYPRYAFIHWTVRASADLPKRRAAAAQRVSVIRGKMRATETGQSIERVPPCRPGPAPGWSAAAAPQCQRRRQRLQQLVHGSGRNQLDVSLAPLAPALDRHARSAVDYVFREIEEARQKRVEQQPETGPHAMVRLLARIVGVGVETADVLVHEVLSRPMRDRRAVARYAGVKAGWVVTFLICSC